MAETEFPFGGGPFGGGPFGPKPEGGFVNHSKTVTANVSASASPIKNAGKIVSAAIDLSVVQGAKTVGKVVTALADASVSVRKAVTFAVAAALFDATGLVVKNVGKPVVAASVTAEGAQGAKDVGKNVTASADFSVTVMRAVAFTVTALADFSVSVRKAVAVTLNALLDAVTASVSIIKAVATVEVVANVTAAGSVIKSAAITLTAQVSAIVAAITATLFIVSTNILQKPINCVLAGHQKFFDRLREYDIRPTKFRSRAAGRRSSVRRLGGEAPSFRVKTDKRGYD
jgi:hypothetical protein